MNHDAAREAAANLAYPDTGQLRWQPTLTALVHIPKPVEKWTVQWCADLLGCEPSGHDDWREHAECRGSNPATFFPDPRAGSNTNGHLGRAREVCEACPVKAECLAFALNNHERFGCWAGMGVRELQHIRAGGRPALDPIECGTRRGYRQHRRRDEDPCQACKAAHNAELQAYKAIRRARAS